VISSWRIRSAAALCLVVLAIVAAGADAAEIDVPLDLDYLLLDAALQQQLYTGQNGRAEFWKSPDNCGYFYAQNPRFLRTGEAVELTTDSQLNAGIGVGGQCLSVVEWSGIIDAATAPYIDGFALKFRVTDINVYNPGQAAKPIGGRAMDIVKASLLPRLQTFSYDLAPYVRQLNALMDAVLADATDAKSVLSSLRLASEVVPRDDGVRLMLRMTLPEALVKPPPVRPPTSAETLAWRHAARQVAAMLDTAATQIGAMIPDVQTRDQLTSVLADARRRVQHTQGEPLRSTDPLRLFKPDWEQLRAIAKAVARRTGPNPKTITLLSFVTATDAVFALDERAPTLGARISRAGLDQLARRLGQPD
jgi:hypothetical protein